MVAAILNLELRTNSALCTLINKIATLNVTIVTQSKEPGAYCTATIFPWQSGLNQPANLPMFRIGLWFGKTPYLSNLRIFGSTKFFPHQVFGYHQVSPFPISLNCSLLSLHTVHGQHHGPSVTYPHQLVRVSHPVYPSGLLSDMWYIKHIAGTGKFGNGCRLAVGKMGFINID